MPMEEGDAAPNAHPLEARPKLRIRAGAGNEPPRQRAVVEPSAADDERQPAATERSPRIARAASLAHTAPPCRSRSARRCQSDDAGCLARSAPGTLSVPMSKPAIHGRRVAVHNLALEPLGKRQSERALSGCGRAEDREDEWLVRVSSRQSRRYWSRRATGADAGQRKKRPAHRGPRRGAASRSSEAPLLRAASGPSWDRRRRFLIVEESDAHVQRLVGVQGRKRNASGLDAASALYTACVKPSTDEGSVTCSSLNPTCAG